MTATEEKQQTESGQLEVEILSQFKAFYRGPATSVSAENKTGPFDILAGHANFLTLILPGDLIIRKPDGEEEKFEIERGVMHVNNDQVKIFLDV